VGTSSLDGRGSLSATSDRLILLENRTYLASTTAVASQALTLAPNPATGSVSLRRAGTTATATVRILDNLGRVVQQSAFATGQANLHLTISGLAAGIYTVGITAAAASANRARLVVQ
jgi:hypothetical protein